MLAIENMEHPGKSGMIGLYDVTHCTGSRRENRNDNARILITGTLPDKIADFERLGHYPS